MEVAWSPRERREKRGKRRGKRRGEVSRMLKELLMAGAAKGQGARSRRTSTTLPADLCGGPPSPAPAPSVARRTRPTTSRHPEVAF